MAKKKAAKKKAAKKQGHGPPRSLVALKTYRCGEPDGASKAAPAAIDKLMVQYFGTYARIFKGGQYPNVPGELADALIKDNAAREV